VSRAARLILACAVAAGSGEAFAKKAVEPSGPVRLECHVALLAQGQLSASTPVTISFVADGGTLRDIRVVDKGGILFPGGNFRFVHKPDVISMEAVEMPAERPGRWSGKVDKKMYRLKLASGAIAEAVTISVSRTVSKSTGRFGMVWNATNQPEGVPQPISGSGGGLCVPAPREASK
jgi:hypothetical protein